MGQIKNIKLHIVTDIKIPKHKMAENGTENGTGEKRKLSDDENGEVEQAQKKMKSGKECGTLLFSGLTDYGLCNNAELFNQTEDVKWEAHRFKALEGVRFREVSSGPLAYFTLAISEEGEVYAWGLNAKGQLGLGDMRNRKTPTLIEGLKNHNIVAVAVGRQHCLLLNDEGEVFACGDNAKGQCGIGKARTQTCVPVKVEDKSMGPVKSVRCADEFSLFLTEDGKVFACGSPENGQLGHGREDKEIAGKKEIFHFAYTPNEIELFVEKDEGEVVSHGQPRIVYIDVGQNHSCAIDDNQRLFTWGFGGYGRLGHNSTANELRPRLMKCWYRVTGRADGGVTRVWCGGAFNIVDTIVDKMKYMFGQMGPRNKEANMYPKPMDDLMGWNVRHVACGQFGFTICADDQLIGSQPSPGVGQLAMGKTRKSAGPPMIITTMKDVHVLRTGQGYTHACFLVRDQTEKDLAAIEKFPTMEFDASEDVEEEEEEEVAPKKGRPKGKAATANSKKIATKASKGGKASKKKRFPL